MAWEGKHTLSLFELGLGLTLARVPFGSIVSVAFGSAVSVAFGVIVSVAFGATVSSAEPPAAVVWFASAPVELGTTVVEATVVLTVPLPDDGTGDSDASLGLMQKRPHVPSSGSWRSAHTRLLSQQGT
jgi:hypothetical protein